MRILRGTLTLMIVAIISYNISAMAFAQTNNNDPNLLKGKWVLDTITAFEENGQTTPYSLDNLSCCIPTEIDIQPDVVAIVRNGHTDRLEYGMIVRENSICFAMCAEWKIEENKLLLQWTQDVEGQEPDRLTIVLTYNSK